MGLTRRIGRAEGGETCFSEARWEAGEEGRDGGREGGRGLIQWFLRGGGTERRRRKEREIKRQDKTHARIHFFFL